jgi:selenophosphate synthetase-related protein
MGATIDVDAIPKPEGVSLERWLTTFPSFGFLLSVADENLNETVQRFRERDIACAAIGRVDGSRTVKLKRGASVATLWDFGSEPLIGCGTVVPEAEHAA